MNASNSTDWTALRLAEMAMSGGKRNLESTVRILACRPGGVGPSPTVTVINAQHGFDWDSGSLLLRPAQPLTPLTPEDVAAIHESVRKGSSWHAYEKWKKQEARIKELEQEVARLKGQINA